MSLPMNAYRPLVAASRLAVLALADEAREGVTEALFEVFCNTWGLAEFTGYTLRLSETERDKGEPGVREMREKADDPALFFAAVLLVMATNADKLKTPETLVQASYLLVNALLDDSGLEEEDFARLVDPRTANAVYGEPTLN